MKKIRIGMAFDGDYLRTENDGFCKIIKITNNYNAFVERYDHVKFWINTAVDNGIIAAYTIA